LIASYLNSAFSPCTLESAKRRIRRGTSAFERLSYGVGEGEAAPSAGEGDASVSVAFFLVVAFFFRGAGDGDLVAAAVVEVAVVPCCCGAQEAINAMPIKTVIKDNTGFFIYLDTVKDRRMLVPRAR